MGTKLKDTEVSGITQRIYFLVVLFIFLKLSVTWNDRE
jgi:hypothetical protein